MVKIFLLLIGIPLLAVCFWIGVRAAWLIAVSEKLQLGARPFEQTPQTPQLSFLVVGDSTAFGTGTTDNRESVAGRLGADFPTALVQNKGVNGKKTAALAHELKEEKEHFDLTVIQIGGNDIIRFTDTEMLRRDIGEVLALAKIKGDRVVLLTSGDVGKAPFFPPLLNWFWSARTADVRDIFQSESKKQGVVYVDLLAAKVSDLFLTDIARYYSADLLHPSGEGYGVWYAEMKKVLEQTGDWERLTQLSR